MSALTATQPWSRHRPRAIGVPRRLDGAASLVVAQTSRTPRAAACARCPSAEPPPAPPHALPHPGIAPRAGTQAARRERPR